MIASIVIQLRALRPGILLNGNGVAAHGAWFKHWNAASSEVGDAIHDSSGVKPFTLSPLMDLPAAGREGMIHFPVGQISWLRITTLQDELTERLLDPENGWLAEVTGAPCFEVDDTFWQVIKVARQAEEHPLANCISYLELRDRVSRQLPPPTRWRLTFDTPMTLNGDHFPYPFPQPESLVKSWLTRWNAFAPFDLSSELPALARQHLSIEEYTLKTTGLRGRGKTIKGCCGTILYQAHGMSAEERLSLALLFEYAFYCGSGYKTTQGLGQTRLVWKA
jgi:CRISPR-associated endoribonuclease Cas6